MKGLYYANLSQAERNAIYWDMHKQCNGIEWIESALEYAWVSFGQGLFDGVIDYRNLEFLLVER